MERGWTHTLRAVREKMSELSTVGLKLEDDIKLAIILNGLPERYRYLVVNLEKQEKIDFDELTARLLEELKINPPSMTAHALMSKKNLYSGGGCVEREYRCYTCGEVGHVKRDCPKREKEKPRVAKFCM
jgi:gag-polypeptide of LTR copia-type/Zinc knuckle